VNLIYSALNRDECRAHVCMVMNPLKVENFFRAQPLVDFEGEPFSTKLDSFISRIAKSDWLTLKRN
jgi:hypothetical protein